MLTQREKLLPHLRHRWTTGTKVGSWYFLRCTVSSCFCRKCLLQSRQEKGFSPVCVRTCAVKHRSWGKAGVQLTRGGRVARIVHHYRAFLPQERCGPHQGQGLLRARGSGCGVPSQPGLQETCPPKQKKNKQNQKFSTAHTWRRRRRRRRFM